MIKNKTGKTDKADKADKDAKNKLSTGTKINKTK